MTLDYVKYREYHGYGWKLTFEGMVRESITDITLFSIGLVFSVYLHHSIAFPGISGVLRAELMLIRLFGTIIPKVKILHSGGGKKLIQQKVDKKTFNTKISSLFNTNPQNIIDYYGMVEQVGVVFVDCEEGWKHVPDFADIIIRNFYTMEKNGLKDPGLIEIMSILPSSYPGQALLTEDVGEIIGIDDCPCGRKGKYFTFKSRVERVELRGCGDTFAERRGE